MAGFLETFRKTIKRKLVEKLAERWQREPLTDLHAEHDCGVTLIVGCDNRVWGTVPTREWMRLCAREMTWIAKTHGTIQ